MNRKSHIHQSTIVALERAISAQSKKAPELMEKQRRLLEARLRTPLILNLSKVTNIAFKGRQPLDKVAPNHPFAKPQITFLPRRAEDVRKRSMDQDSNTAAPKSDTMLRERKTNGR